MPPTKEWEQGLAQLTAAFQKVPDHDPAYDGIRAVLSKVDEAMDARRLAPISTGVLRPSLRDNVAGLELVARP